jgi:hypothetical protein
MFGWWKIFEANSGERETSHENSLALSIAGNLWAESKLTLRRMGGEDFTQDRPCPINAADKCPKRFDSSSSHRDTRKGPVLIKSSHIFDQCGCFRLWADDVSALSEARFQEESVHEHGAPARVR